MGALTTLARTLTAPFRKAEGDRITGPLARVHYPDSGWLPMSWPLNWWQCGHNVLAFGDNAIVEACVWAYISAVAQLPGFHKRELANGGTENVNSSALSRILRVPNAYETPSDFLTHLIRSLLYAGNSYWLAARNDRFEVSALHWTDPRQCQVQVVRVEDGLSEVFYRVGDNPLLPFAAARDLLVPARDVLHIKLATPRHPLIGETWLNALAVQLAQSGVINASITTAAANMRPAGILSTDLILTSAQVAEARERWAATSANMAQGGVPILTAGMKFQPVTMSAEDAKTIEQLKLSDRAIAAVFGVPAMLVGLTDAGSPKSAEALMAEWLSARLGWMIDHVERAFDAFFALDQLAAGREWTEYDTRALLRSLFAERIDGLVRGVQGGVYAPNEARRLEGYPEVEGGDEPRVQQQLLPLSAVMAPPAPPAAAAPPAAPPAANDDEASEDDKEAARAVTRYLLGKQMTRVRDEKRRAA